MKVRVTGSPSFTSAGTSFVASVPVGAYDDGNWMVAQTILSIPGITTDTLATFKAALQSAVASWKTSFTASETLKLKLGKIEGMEV